MSKTANAQSHQHALDAINRYQMRPKASGNELMECSPEGFARVSPLRLAEIRHARPPFNWPKESTPFANAITLAQMAQDVLSESGFEREASSFKEHYRRKTPSFSNLPNLMHAYLDFEPAKKISPEELDKFRALAAAAGLDPEKIAQAKKKAIKNPLAHPRMSLIDEWNWLVAHARVVSPFGKTAACELSTSAIVDLSAMWIKDASSPMGDPNDCSFGNRAWFDKSFPLGWMALDHLHETPIVSAPLGFPGRMLALAQLVATKSAQGWSSEELIANSFDHSNILGINGAALIAAEAFEYFERRMLPVVRGTSPDHAYPAEEALAEYMKATNPNAPDVSPREWTWLAYACASPFAAQQVSNAWLDSEQERLRRDRSSPDNLDLIRALTDKLAIQSSSVVLCRADAKKVQPPMSKPAARL